MKISLLLLNVLLLSSCKHLSPEQNAALFEAGLQAGQRVLVKVSK